MTLTADQGQVNGTGVENAFDNSVWVFRGAVKVTMDQGVINSDEARVTFSNKVSEQSRGQRQARAHSSRQIAKTGKIAQGHADTIDYDVTKGISASLQECVLGQRSIMKCTASR